jgi:murein L,D-transpeptidase YafK
VRLAAIATILLGLSCAPTAPAGSAASRSIRFNPAHYGPEVPLAELVRDSSLQLDENQHLADARLLVLKSAYELRLYSGERRIKTYRIQLGKHPVGAKSRRGDARTPEGSYRICNHNRGSRYYLSLQIDYPNEADIARGLETKAITANEADRLRAELASGACPTLRTRLGGDIFIHGQHPGVTKDIKREGRGRTRRKDLQSGDQDPGTMTDGYNWTLGCIGMTNPDIRELFQFLPDGTTVEILK